MEYEHQNHSKFLLMYHVIFVCKYRKKILEPIKEELKEVIHSIENDSDFEVLEAVLKFKSILQLDDKYVLC